MDRKLKARKLSERLVTKLEFVSNKLESSIVVTSCQTHSFYEHSSLSAGINKRDQESFDQKCSLIAQKWGKEQQENGETLINLELDVQMCVSTCEVSLVLCLQHAGQISTLPTSQLV